MTSASIVAGSAVFGLMIYLAWWLSSKVSDEDATQNPYDVERMRKDLLASAENDQELEYLQELDALDLHRKHLVC
ncbi:MAG: hypothetical protein ACR2OW_10130 [Methyloligellaceae bacterium]